MKSFVIARMLDLPWLKLLQSFHGIFRPFKVKIFFFPVVSFFGKIEKGEVRCLISYIIYFLNNYLTVQLLKLNGLYLIFSSV